MTTWRVGLAVLCIAASALLLLNIFINAASGDTAEFIWNYIADPAAIAAIALTTLVNVRDSLRVRGASDAAAARQLPRDVVTALTAIVGVRYLQQYVAHWNDQDAGWLWDYLVAIAIVLLAFEAITHWRAARRRM